MNDNMPTHDTALLAFATDFEFVKRLVDALGPGGINPKAKAEIGRWLTVMVDGASVYAEGQIRPGQEPSSELRTLIGEVAEARAWLNAFEAKP